MAQRELLVRIVGDDKSLRRAFTTSSRAAKDFERDMGRATRGALAGSGAFGAFGRSIAFASTAFLGAAGLTAAIRGAFTEMNESRKVTAQTNAALKSTGAVAGVTAQHVEELGNALLRKTGIDDEAIRSSENLLLTFRNVRNVVGDGNDVFDQATTAILDMSVAMGEDLKDATVRVGKALQDPVRGMTALRRVGVQFTESQEKQIKAFVTAGRLMDAQRVILRELTQEFGGSAEAAGNVQPWNLLRETLRNISKTLAESLLPQIQEITARLQKWFDNTENVERIQKDFADAIKVTGEVLATLRSVIEPVIEAVGGLRNAVKILIGVLIAKKVLDFATAIRLIGVESVIAGGGVKTLAGRLATLQSLGPIGVVIAVSYVAAKGLPKAIGGQPLFSGGLTGESRGDFNIRNTTNPIRGIDGVWRTSDGSPVEDQGFWEKMYRAGKVTRTGKRTRGGVFAGAGSANDRLPSQVKALADSFRTTPAGARPPGTITPRTPGGITASQRNTFFDNTVARLLDRVQDSDLQAQIGKLTKIASLIQARIAVTKDITRRLTLEDRLLDVRRAIKGVRSEIADNLKQAAEDAKQRAQDALEAAQEAQQKLIEARNALQFRALGLSATGGVRTPGVDNLRKQLGSLSQAVEGTFLDTTKTQSLMNRIRKVLSGGFGKVSEDVRATIRDMLQDIREQLKHADRTITKGRALNVNSVLQGLGLDPEETRALRARLSHVGAGGKVLNGPRSGALGFAIAGGGGLTVNIQGDVVTQNADAFVRDIQKKARRVATQTTGAHAGNAMGFVR